jgi:hypothetical protein
MPVLALFAFPEADLGFLVPIPSKAQSFTPCCTVCTPQISTAWGLPQEALQNTVKHRRERNFRVELPRHAGGDSLTVSDGGVGFNQADATS